MKRASALALVAGLGVVLGVPSVASATWHHDSPPKVMSSWTDSAGPGKSFATGDRVDLPLGTRVDDAGVTHTSRIYATFDLSQYEGQKLAGGTITVEERSAADCTKRSIEVWRTKAVSTMPTWKRAPVALSKQDEEQDPRFCPRATITFDVSSAITEAKAARQRLVTFELRVSAEHEADPAYGRTLYWYRDVVLSLTYNTVPKIDSEHLYTGGVPCTQLKPYPVRNISGGNLQARVLDPDMYEQLTAEFAVWPVGSPDARTIYPTDRAQSGRVATVQVPETDLVHGAAYGWQARVSDGTETTPWSKKCFFRYDNIAPSAPAVTSTTHRPNVSGPVGQHPTFVFDGHKDKDIAGFQYSWQSLGVNVCSLSGEYGQWECPDPWDLPDVVKADVPGGRATVTLNPDLSGPTRLAVRSMDLAGNTSPTVYYEVFIASSTPRITVESGTPEWNQQVLLKLEPAAGITGVTEYRIERPGEQADTREPDENGVAYYRFLASDADGGEVTVRSVSSGGFVSAPARWRYHFSPWPGVRSTVYDDRVGGPQGGVGVEGSFIFSPPPGWFEVAGYRYSFDSSAEPTVVPAGEDGRATITWTPETGGYHYLQVHAVKADGTLSEYGNSYSFQVAE